MNHLLKFDICRQYVLLYILYYNYVLFFNRGPRGRLAIIANCVFLYKYCINKIKIKKVLAVRSECFVSIFLSLEQLSG